MANTKGKIIIGSGIVIVGGLLAWKITKNVKQNKIQKIIMEQLNDPKNLGATVGGNEIHKYSLALDPKFWKKIKGSPLPSRLMTDKLARERARKINDNMGGTLGWDNESTIISEIKKSSTQGQLSQIASQFEAQGFGNLGDRLEDTLQEGLVEKDRLKELNNFINSLPY